MDIHDISLAFDLSPKKLRRMETAGVLRVGKSRLARHWQMVRSDIKKGKLSSRSIALAYRYPRVVESIIDLSHRQRAMMAEHFAAADLPKDVPAPVESIPSIGGIACSAAEGGQYLDRFILMVQALIPDNEVGHHYIAVRILLMCRNEYDIDGAYKHLRRALTKAKDKTEMTDWWRSEKTGGTSGTRTIYHRPKADFDL